jgi:hypothetical protein
MRLLFRVAIVLIISLVAIALPAARAQAQHEDITLHPGSGYVGQAVYVTGTNFTEDDYWVYYETDGDWEEVLDSSDCEVSSSDVFSTEEFLIPESHGGDHEIRVCNSHSSSTSYRVAYEYFTVKPKIEIAYPGTAEGPVGTTVTVEGLGFAQNEENVELWYDDEVIEDDIPVDGYGSWETTFQIPRSAQGSHKIDAGGDDSRLYQVGDVTFTVTAGISLSTLSGSVGDNITVTGNGFRANERDIKILFDGEPVETGTEMIRADDTGHWTAVLEVPEMPKGTYSVSAEGEFTDKEDITALIFEIRPGLVLSPNQGHVGTNVTVTGGGFAANKAVDIMYDGSHVDTTGTNTAGGFEVTFRVPESQHGQRQVTAQDTAGNDATAIFAMESVPPGTPEPISPADGARVGLTGSVTPTFEWSAVSDPSGVRYSLQIATSDNVTATGEFVDPKVSIPNIVGTNYTLNATQALSYGTYYWIVQAVDRAENESGWTEPISLRVGLLPLWAFIAIIIAIVALIGTLLYFFVIRKRIYYY